jgi:hypothetical protein
MIEVDYSNIREAIDLCNKSVKYDSHGTCYAEMVNYAGYNFHPGSKEQNEICSMLPGTWKQECTDHVSGYAIQNRPIVEERNEPSNQTNL